MIYLLGYPGDVGGANTECWHALKLWRSLGIEVVAVPTWGPPAAGWRERLDGIGVQTVDSPGGIATVAEVPGIGGSVVAGFCNAHFIDSAPALHKLGCRLVWVGCMNFLFPAERLFYQRTGRTFDRYVYQSRFQRDRLVPQIRKHGARDDQVRLIHGWIDVGEFPLEPRRHQAGEIFTIGKLARAKTDKWNRDLWICYMRIPHSIRARVMGWDREVERYVGKPPACATTLGQGQEPALRFLRTLHALVPVDGEAVENWPRIGLEAMAAGVPVVADARGGWPEMIIHGETGYLCRTHEEIAYYTARLAYDEQHRMGMILAARSNVERLADRDVIGGKWMDLFKGLE